jgi:hypothetical protein
MHDFRRDRRIWNGDMSAVYKGASEKVLLWEPPPHTATPAHTRPETALPGPRFVTDDLVDPTTEGLVAPLRSTVPRWMQRLVGPLLLLLCWQGLASLHVFDPRTTPAPGTVLLTAIDLVMSDELQAHLIASLERVAEGLSIGVVLGLVTALISGLTRWGENVVDGNMEILRAIPNFAVLPILVAWFGIGEFRR